MQERLSLHVLAEVVTRELRNPASMVAAPRGRSGHTVGLVLGRIDRTVSASPPPPAEGRYVGIAGRRDTNSACANERGPATGRAAGLVRVWDTLRASTGARQLALSVENYPEPCSRSAIWASRRPVLTARLATCNFGRRCQSE